jgi:hypothetical protein
LSPAPMLSKSLSLGTLSRSSSDWIAESSASSVLASCELRPEAEPLADAAPAAAAAAPTVGVVASAAAAGAVAVIDAAADPVAPTVPEASPNRASLREQPLTEASAPAISSSARVVPMVPRGLATYLPLGC